MKQRGLSYAEMQRKLLEEQGTRLSKASISYWLRGIHDPSGSLNRFSSEPTPELSYVIGVALSDGNINVHDYHREILLSVTDEDFASEFRQMFRENPWKKQALQSQVEREEKQMDSARVQRASSQVSKSKLVGPKNVH